MTQRAAVGAVLQQGVEHLINGAVRELKGRRFDTRLAVIPTPNSISLSCNQTMAVRRPARLQAPSATPMEWPRLLSLATQLSAGFKRIAAFGGRADQLLNQDGVGDAAASGGVEAVFDRHVVIDDDGWSP